jgi:hypothetical protein|tara:strand:+ start:1113 stop:1385 length:273 start_codon:yes stop_codon:yes gene_type:complete
MADSDVKSKRITATGSVGVGPARIRQIQLKTAAGTPRLTVTDGNGGSTVVDLDFNASTTHSVNIPSNGIRVSDINVSVLTNIDAVTFFYC